MANWYVFAGEHQYGPVSEDTLKGWIRDGRLRGEDFAWADTLSEWVPLAKVPAFAANFSTTSMGAPSSTLMDVATPNLGTEIHFAERPAEDTRRRHLRMFTSLEMQFALSRGAGKPEDYQRANVKDISFGGLAFECNVEVSGGSILKADILIPDGGERFRCLLEVRRAAPGVAPGAFDVGCKFHNLSPAERRILFDRLATALLLSDAY